MAKKCPKRIVAEFTVDPYQGFAAIAASICPPKGYMFHEMKRKGTKAIVT
jgi:hypothetical protein